MPSLRGVSENVLGNLIAGGAVFIASVALSRLDASVPAWVIAAGVGTALWAGIFVGRLSRVGEDLAGYHAEHLGEIILTLREVFAGHLTGISFEEFIERGVLAPARFGLSRVPGEEVRLSVLAPNEARSAFRMLYEAGHTVGRKQAFSLPMASLAGHAYESRQIQWTNDVRTDNRWQPHPKARPDRAYESITCAPIIVGDEVVAVLSVISTERGAFLRGDLTYLELLATLIALAWTTRTAAD